jgi:hypothetical protein
MITQIEVAGQSVGVVSMPASPGFSAVEWSFSDAVPANVSPFTGATQTYGWPGADKWLGTMTLPKLKQSEVAQWKAFLMECRGISKPFLLGDPLQPSPQGSIQGSTPLIDNETTAGSNQAGMTMLATKGWTQNRARLLLPGDYLQIGYRMHVNINVVTADANGKATLSVWPSLRELPTDSAAIGLKHVKGLFRRANNVATWSTTVGQWTSLSFQVMEYR